MNKNLIISFFLLTSISVFESCEANLDNRYSEVNFFEDMTLFIKNNIITDKDYSLIKNYINEQRKNGNMNYTMFTYKQLKDSSIEFERNKILEQKLKEEAEKEEQRKITEFYKNRIFIDDTNKYLIDHGSTPMGIIYYLELTGDIITLSRRELLTNGQWEINKISGHYKITNKSSITVKWENGNILSYITFYVQDCPGLTKIKDDWTFPDSMDINFSDKSISMTTSFKQEYFSGSRCGGEDKMDTHKFKFFPLKD